MTRKCQAIGWRWLVVDGLCATSHLKLLRAHRSVCRACTSRYEPTNDSLFFVFALYLNLSTSIYRAQLRIGGCSDRVAHAKSRDAAPAIPNLQSRLNCFKPAMSNLRSTILTMMGIMSVLASHSSTFVQTLHNLLPARFILDNG